MHHPDDLEAQHFDGALRQDRSLAATSFGARIPVHVARGSTRSREPSRPVTRIQHAPSPHARGAEPFPVVVALRGLCRSARKRCRVLSTSVDRTLQKSARSGRSTKLARSAGCLARLGEIRRHASRGDPTDWSDWSGADLPTERSRASRTSCVIPNSVATCSHQAICSALCWQYVS